MTTLNKLVTHFYDVTVKSVWTLHNVVALECWSGLFQSKALHRGSCSSVQLVVNCETWSGPLNRTSLLRHNAERRAWDTQHLVFGSLDGWGQVRAKGQPTDPWYFSFYCNSFQIIFNKNTKQFVCVILW